MTFIFLLSQSTELKFSTPQIFKLKKPTTSGEFGGGGAAKHSEQLNWGGVCLWKHIVV